MRVLLNIMVRYVSPTSHSTVLLMPTQKFLRILLDMLTHHGIRAKWAVHHSC